MISAVSCPTCNTSAEGVYCSHCGEKVKVERITLRYIVSQVVDVYLGVESGLLHTFIEMIKNPGKLFHEYFGGKRQPFYKPMKYALLMGSLAILMALVLKKRGENLFLDNSTILKGFPELSIFLKDNIATFINGIFMLQFPIMALLTWIRHLKKKYTYGEHLYANALIVGELLAIQLIMDSIMVLGWNIWPNLNLEPIYAYLTIPYIIYAYSSWIHGKIRFPRIILSAGFIIACYAISFILAILVAGVFLYFFTILF